MKKKSIAMLIGCMLTIFCFGTFSMQTDAAQASEVVEYSSEENAIEPRTDIKEWKYAVKDGNLYKRLYNYSTGRWETDWILVIEGV